MKLKSHYCINLNKGSLSGRTTKKYNFFAASLLFQFLYLYDLKIYRININKLKQRQRIIHKDSFQKHFCYKEFLIKSLSSEIIVTFLAFIRKAANLADLVTPPKYFRIE